MQPELRSGKDCLSLSVIQANLLGAKVVMTHSQIVVIFHNGFHLRPARENWRHLFDLGVKSETGGVGEGVLLWAALTTLRNSANTG